jgi:nucleotide-binding universal stress UspA family protein
VVGVDDSEGARLALDWAYEEACSRRATLDVVHVWSYPYYGALTPSVYVDARAIESAAQAHLDRLVAPYAGRGIVEVHSRLVEGPPAATLCAVAEGADLLVVGSRGRGGFKGLLLGSVGQQVAHHARCPVAIVPPRPRANDQAA